MPKSLESFSIRFLYPDNWVEAERGESEGLEGVTLELPSGGFFSIERIQEDQPLDELIDQIIASFQADYGEIEREDLVVDRYADVERAVEIRFYYLDLLVLSRLLVLHRGGRSYVVQMQAESRDFDANELVFDAIMKQLAE